MEKSTYKIPFDADGNMLSYAEGKDPHLDEYAYAEDAKGRPVSIAEWREPTEFVATMALVSYYKGRSTVRLIVHDENGHEYALGLSEFFKALKSEDMRGGEITATWRCAKRGSYFVLRYVGGSDARL